jgi:UDP-galactopyranose mutase
MNTFSKLWNINTPEEAKDIISRQCNKYKNIEPTNLEEQALKLCGDDIYSIFIKDYTEKQWGRSPRELPASIIKRIPFRFTYNNNYFDDQYQGIPFQGYNQLIYNLLKSKNIHFKINTDYFGNRNYFNSIAKKTLFTGCIDEFFNYKLGKLDYRSLKFEHIQLETDNYQGNAVVNFSDKNIPYTRIIEHKHFEFGIMPHTIITKEFPQDFTYSEEPYYPVNDDKNTKLLNDYKKLSAGFPYVIFGGRLGQYSYFDMDDTIAAAMSLANQELSVL